jgi:DNA-directed RNA polymerase specialized sigma24 family protein
MKQLVLKVEYGNLSLREVAKIVGIPFSTLQTHL